MSLKSHLSSPASAPLRARGKGIQVFEHLRRFATWAPFPSRPTGRSAGNDNLVLEVLR